MITSFFKYSAIRVLTRKTTYVAILIIICGAFCTLKRNSVLYNLDKLDFVGGLNLFIFSSIKENGVMSVLAPFVIMIVYPSVIFEDIQNHYVDQLYLRMSKSKYYLIQTMQSFFISGSVYVIAHGATLILYFCVSPANSIMLAFINGPFSNVYYKSLTLYCVVFIAHSFLFGSIIGILGMGLAMNLHNKCILWVLPTLIYYLGFYLLILFPEKIQRVLIYIIPLLPYEITTFDIPVAAHISQLFVIFVVGIILILNGINYDSNTLALYVRKRRLN